MKLARSGNRPVALAVALTCVWCVTGSALADTPPEEGLRWDQRLMQEQHIYRLLLKEYGYGPYGSEEMLWHAERRERRGPGAVLTDQKREPALRELLDKHGESHYADDTALLLARARFFYHADPEGAIRELYKVIKDYPLGHWIAEDTTWLRLGHGPFSSGKHVTPKKNVTRRRGIWGTLSPREEGGTAWEKITYFEYLEKNPHLTRDEAKYWIAWIIIVADLRDRFPEAQRNLKEVVDAHRKTGRTAKDMEAAKGLNGAKIGKRIVRSERKCHQLLIRFYLKQGNEAEARIALADLSRR